MTISEFLTNWYNLLTIIIGLVATIVLMIISNQNHTKSYQLRAYIPTVWTSLGIFFTFFAIWKGLPAIKGVDENNILTTLIDKVIPAFSTSIIGIAGAVITSLINKIKLALDEGEINDKFDGLNSFTGIDSDSPELLLFKLISAVNQKGDAIYNQIDKKAKDSTNAANNKAQDIYNELTSLLRELKDETNKARSIDLSKQNESFQEAVKSMMDAFNVALKSQNDTLSNKMDDLGNILKKEIEDIQSENRGLIGQLVDAEKQLLEITGEKLGNESAERNRQLREFIAEQTSLYNEIKAGLDNAVSDIRNLFETDVKQAVEHVAEAQLAISTQTLTKWNEDLTEKSNTYLNDHLELVKGYISNLTNQIDSTRQTFEESINGLPEAMAKKLDELHEKETELVKATISDNRTGVDTLLSENKKALQDAIADLGTNLQDSFEGIKNVITSSIKTNEENLAGLIGRYDASIKAVSDEIKTDNESIKSELVEAQKRWKESAEQCEMEHLEMVKKINQDAAREIQSIQTKITSIESVLHASLDGIMTKVTESIGHFVEKQDEIKKFVIENNKGLQTDLTQQIRNAFQIEELAKERDKLIEGINSTVNTLKTQTSLILANLGKVNDELKNNNVSFKESSTLYRDTVVKSNDLITYIHGTLNLIKSHLTQMNVVHSEINTLHTEVDVFQKALQELEKSIKEVKGLMDGVAKKQTGKDKPNK